GFADARGRLKATTWWGARGGPKTGLDVPAAASATPGRGWLAVKPRTTWTVGGQAYAPDTVVGISLAAFLAGDRQFTTLFRPAGRRALQTFCWCGGRLILSLLDDLKPVFEVFTPSADGWSAGTIPALPHLATAPRR